MSWDEAKFVNRTLNQSGRIFLSLFLLRGVNTIFFSSPLTLACCCPTAVQFRFDSHLQ